MPRDGSCDTGKKGYSTKAEGQQQTGQRVERCDRCRQWHAPTPKGGKRRAKQAARKARQ